MTGKILPACILRSMKNSGVDFFEGIEGKKLVLVNLWPGSTMHYTIQLSNRLVKKNRVVLYLSRDCEVKYFDGRVEVRKVDVTVPGRYARVWDYPGLFNPLNYWKVVREVGVTDYDLLVVVFFHPFLIGLLRMERKVFIYHDPSGHLGERNIVLHIMQRLFSYHSDYVVVHDSGLIPDDIPLYQSAKYRIGRHGTFDFLKEVGDKSIKPQKEILFVGRFVKYKGVEYLIKAFAEIQDEFPDWKLVIKGSGKPYFKKELKKINPDQLVFENKYLSDEELVNSVRRASIIALPYVDGSHSGVYELARTFGKRVVENSGKKSNFIDELLNVLTKRLSEE